MRSRRPALVVAVAAVVLSGFITASAAHAAPPVDGSADIALGVVTDMVVDQTHGLVFYDNDSPGWGFAVSRLDGSDMTYHSGITTTTPFVQGPDGRMYIGSGKNAIDAIDPTTLQVTPYSLGSTMCPSSIAFVGSQLWFAYQCGSDGNEGLATLDSATDAVTTFPIRTSAANPARLVSVPNHPSLLVGSDVTGDGQLSLIDVSSGTPTVTASTASLLGARDTGPVHVAVAPDGSSVLAASTGLGGAASFSTTDLTSGPTSYQGEPADQLAISADGALLAAAGAGGTKLSTYHLGTAAPIRTYVTTAGYRGYPTALAWTGSTLLAVYGDETGTRPELAVLRSALQAPTTLRLSVPKSATRATPITVTGQLVGVANVPVIITKRDLVGAHTLGTVTTDSNGNFHLPDLPRVGGTNTYVARFIGDETHGPAVTTAVLNIPRGTPVLTLTASQSTYTYGQIVKLTVHLASHDVKKVYIYRSPYSGLQGGGPTYAQTLTVDSHGVAHMNAYMYYNTEFVAEFFGDQYYNPRKVGLIVRDRVAITQTFYGTNIMPHGSRQTYTTAEIRTGVNNDQLHADRIASIEAQRLVAGQWVATGGVRSLGPDGWILRSQFTEPPGRYRERAIVHTTANYVGNTSAWVYFQFLGQF